MPQMRPLPPLFPPQSQQEQHPPSSHALSNLIKPLLPLPPISQLVAAGAGSGDFPALLETLHATLSHTRYAVCGRAALHLHGVPSASSPPPSHVSIMCPASGRDVVLAWGGVAGWDVPGHRRRRRARRPGSAVVRRGTEPGGRDEMGVPVRGGRVWTVRIRCVDEGTWDGVGKRVVSSGGDGEVSVVSLDGLLDQLARAWGRKCEGAWAVELMLGVLSRLGEMGREVTPENVPHVVDQSFWLPFTLSYPEAIPLLGRCGLQGPGRGTFGPDFAMSAGSGSLADRKDNKSGDGVCLTPTLFGDVMMLSVQFADNRRGSLDEERPGTVSGNILFCAASSSI
ncbi:hypothetical protein B0H67DRAFT_548171 [Lasiosphaeris hirsuta]|uniref:Uncharacterized protein n=1 Tax=Lasiosphaeris hirsuta TaxID=260670 RepID=A0AA40B9J7_9PEZI|nr:hypothetical protein B0H67DRAFT_548171 [Lasiosphaeris hirsuta]